MAQHEKWSKDHVEPIEAPADRRRSRLRHRYLGTRTPSTVGYRVLVWSLVCGGVGVIVTVALLATTFATPILAAVEEETAPQETVAEPSLPFEGVYDGLDDATLDFAADSSQALFRAGAFTVEVPETIGSTSHAPFTAAHPDATEWLHAGSALPIDSITVVFTEDPAYNCGLVTASVLNERGVAGCYNPTYYNTVFMWWGPAADEELKTFILQHELSHFFQWWDYYDTIQSAFSSGLFNKEQARREVMESDATCRILEQWGVTSPQSTISVPCVTADWHDTWITEEVAARGTEILAW